MVHPMFLSLVVVAGGYIIGLWQLPPSIAHHYLLIRTMYICPHSPAFEETIPVLHFTWCLLLLSLQYLCTSWTLDSGQSSSSSAEVCTAQLGENRDILYPIPMTALYQPNPCLIPTRPLLYFCYICLYISLNNLVIILSHSRRQKNVRIISWNFVQW